MSSWTPIKKVPWPEGRSWDLLVRFYFFALKHHLGTLGHWAPHLSRTLIMWAGRRGLMDSTLGSGDRVRGLKSWSWRSGFKGTQAKPISINWAKILFFFKDGPFPGSFFLYFHLFSQLNTVKNFSSQLGTNSDHRSSRRESWPLYHHHGPSFIALNYVFAGAAKIFPRWFYFCLPIHNHKTRIHGPTGIVREREFT